MKYTHILLIPLTLASLVSCLATHIETSVTPSAPSAAYTPPLISKTAAASTETAMEDPEIESGEVYDLTTDSQSAKTLCVTAIEAVHLRTEPNAKAIVINWLRAGTQVTAKASAEGWTYAQVRKQSGYIKSEFLGECEK
jgi:uncharacterized protein YgiM (DUF1202 family)